MFPISFYSSWLLFLPAFYAFLSRMPDVVIACITCACLSILHHGHNCIVQAYGNPDRFAARGVALIYGVHSIVTFPIMPLSSALYVVAILILAFYLHIRNTYKEYHKCHDDHWVMHVLIATCLVLYVNIRKSRQKSKVIKF